MAETGFLILEDFLKHLVIEPHNNIAVHLDKATIAVEARNLSSPDVARDGCRRLHR
jgi:hypothetical protein